MHTRDFLFRFRCTYSGEDNTIDGLQVWKQVEGEWKAFDLGLHTPGFEIFCYALLTCQHTYLRLNCAENGLQLEAVDGEMHLSTSEDWDLNHLLVAFSARLRSGDCPDSSFIDSVIERMQQCPVSKNLRQIGDNNVLLAFIECDNKAD